MRYPNALWIGGTANQVPNGMVNVLGAVLHIQDGNEQGTEAWFNNPASQASSHFLNPKTGPIRQMVDTRDKAWAEVAGNAHWISVENEGIPGDSLTDSQLGNVAGLYSWLNQVYGIPFQTTDDPNGQGLGWHGMGGVAWGNHPDCPGDPIKAQRQAILEMASSTLVTTLHAPWPNEYLKLEAPMMHNSNVAHYQQTMLTRGWSGIGTVDGYFGPMCDKVTRQFQQEKGLTVDGVVGPVTWNAAENDPVT
jgi:peptidoglycan hydrolase-like protein with peptidoglycan-binding domain